MSASMMRFFLKRLLEVAGPAYLVKDDILHPLRGEIPVCLLGFLY